MDKLAKEQEVIGQEIQRIIRNFKKDPADRKTRPYYEERLKLLETSWATFDANDSQIRSLPDVSLTHKYFTDSYYDEISELYELYQDQFLQQIKILQQSPMEPAAKTSEPNAKTSEPTSSKVVQQPKSLKLNSETNQERSIPQKSELTDINKILRKQKGTLLSLRHLVNNIKNSDDQPRCYYQVKLETLGRYWKQIEEYNEKIWEISDDPTSAGYDLDEYLKLEEEVQDHFIKLSAKLDSCGISRTTTSPPSKGIITSLKLPEITLPKFDGDYLKWRQFADLFKEMVHKQPLADVQKMWYLKTNLVGEAEKLIRHLTLSEDNYSTAWKMLQDRYENKRLLVAALVNKLLSQPSYVSEVASANSIKNLHDTTQECLLGLENLGISTSNWDPILLHIMIKKLDKTTHMLYEQSLDNPREVQTVKKFLHFLQTRFQSLEALGTKLKQTEDHVRKPNVVKTLSSVICPKASTNSHKCVVCKGNHALYACTVFLKSTTADRLNVLRKHNLCMNCMKPGHSSAKCSLRGCTKCNRKHNTLVHAATPDKSPQPVPTKISVTKTPITLTEEPPTVAAITNERQKKYVMLSTVRVRLTNNQGKSLECRAVLDSGSQVNLITEKLAKSLNLNLSKESLCIQGIGNKRHTTQNRVSAQMSSTINAFTARLEAFVLSHIIPAQPTQPINTTTWAIPHNIQLADPSFNNPGHIDLLLGAEFYPQLLSVGQIRLNDDGPILQNTVLGWIVTGKVSMEAEPIATCGIGIEEESINQQIEKFWRLEETAVPKSNLTREEKRCEDHFTQTVTRSSEGRFIVKLPFLDDPRKLGESKDIAFRRYMALEKKLSKNPELQKQYVDFMNEYIKLGHMEPVDLRTIDPPHYFLPHHSILKPESTTTKLRVVFDASAKTSSNMSLNDILCSGPTIQDDLFSILLRFRLPRFVFTADIQKMYRQVVLDKEDRKYHIILWRNNPNEILRTYQLCTVTYGTTSAPYLATKCLERLALEQTEKYPLGSHVLKTDFYVDDVMTGSNSMIEALEKQAQLIKLLKEAGFILRKWCANHPRLLQNIKLEDQEVQLDFSDEKEEQIKTLGLTWLPKSDQFCIKANVATTQKISKRIIASEIAKLFDPLGIMAPVTVTAKIFLQELWQLKLDWDAALPQELHTKWMKFRHRISYLNNMQVPRHVFTNESCKEFQFHTFADASERAYGAAIYIRAVNQSGIITVRLLCAKSRVAPLKKTTIPRLELCAANLAVELTSRVKEALRTKDAVTYFWTDSEVVLGWINSESSTLQTFVANRISSIQSLSLCQQWRHVGSKENPADVLSRGLSPEKLESCNLWFYGPPFLHGQESLWPAPYTKKEHCDLERKRTTVSIPTSIDHKEPGNLIDTIDHRNSFRRLQRIIAYVLRFVNRTRKVPTQQLLNKALSVRELDEALHVVIKVMQAEEFKMEIDTLRRYKEISKNSSLSTLTPFLDEKGILRVGGRLEASTLPYDARHQMLLPYSHPFTKLLMNDLHQANLHVGPQTLLSITRQRFWPIKGKSIARSIVQHCMRCAKAKPQLFSQLMGNLPTTRVQPARPFINSGVDFCGPITLHYKIRGKRPCKGYIAVFCCFATKAVHFEVVSDLTTEAFIAALKRFVGRRGHCLNLYCDNATNFVGASNQLMELKDNIYSDHSKEIISSECSHKGINFHFIPPRAPHFGGLWEAAVKSAKHLLLRTVASASLTYEELETVIIGIEAILNSRPITPMSNDPNDLAALTPGHFLIGEPMIATIDSATKPIKMNLQNRWKLITRIKQEFWDRWSKEYLNELQYRLKWKQRCHNIKPGTIVVLKEDNLPVMKWPLGRIIKAIPGDDGCVRVADVQTATGVLRRPIHRLAPLPCEEDTTQYEPRSALNEATTQKNKEKRKSEVSHTAKQDTEQDTPKSEETPAKKKRQSMASTLLTFLLTCLIIPSIKANQLEVRKFDRQPGIQFDKLGTTNLVTADWDLVVYYDLQSYWLEYAALINGTLALKHVCNISDLQAQRDTCTEILNQIEHLKNEIDRDNELLSNNSPETRQKRGAFNIVGNVANALFGVLDSEYAEQMSKTIESINQNQNRLLTLLKNQTSIIDSTINIMKRDQLATREKFNALDKQLVQIINKINTTGREHYIHQQMVSLSIQLTLIITSLQRIQSSIIDVLTDIRHGKISPLLLSPSQLGKEMTTIGNHLPSSLRLPGTQDDLLHLYQLMSVKGRVVKKHVIFQIKLPLMNREEFELYKVLPIPFVVNGTMMTINPSTTYLAITTHRDEYYPLSDKEFMSCVLDVDKGIYLCYQHHPIYRRGSGVSKCEISLLNDSPDLTECQMRLLKESAVWLQTSNPNQWIYALKEEITINAVCGKEVFTMTLEGSGLLTLESNCVVKHDSLTIYGHQKHHSKLKTSYVKLSHASTIQNTPPADLTPEEMSHYRTQLKELALLQKQLSSQHLELPKIINDHTSHNAVIGYVTLGATIIIVAYLTTKMILKMRPQKQHVADSCPTPKPRKQQDLDFSINVG